MVYVSTGGNKSQTAYKTACDYGEIGITNYELSGGLHDPEISKNISYLSSKGNVQLHNYFPPPKQPFVINLASSDHETIERTKKHIQFSIDLSAKMGTYLYSFHAGSLIDLRVNELGKRVKKRKLINRDVGIKKFLENINDLAIYAGRLGVSLLIENNVLSLNNYDSFESNPFLMVDAEECKYVMKESAENVSLLVDVGHLRVSAASLDFGRIEFLEAINPWIRAYHLSDNDGLADSNESIHEKSWFWPHIRSDLDYYALEVYGKNPSELAEQVKLTESILSIVR